MLGLCGVRLGHDLRIEGWIKVDLIGLGLV